MSSKDILVVPWHNPYVVELTQPKRKLELQVPQVGGSAHDGVVASRTSQIDIKSDEHKCPCGHATVLDLGSIPACKRHKTCLIVEEMWVDFTLTSCSAEFIFSWTDTSTTSD